MSAVRKTIGKGKDTSLEDHEKFVSDAALREYCDKYYHQLLQIISEKLHQEKKQQEKFKALEAVKDRLNFQEIRNIPNWERQTKENI